MLLHISQDGTEATTTLDGWGLPDPPVGMEWMDVTVYADMLRDQRRCVLVPKQFTRQYVSVTL